MYLTTVVALVVGPVTSLTGLWLRLRWQARREEARLKAVVALARAGHGRA